MPSTHPHVVVLGGGIAGLTAARNLAAHGINVTLLEARNRLGGRIHTSHFHHGGHDGDQGCTSPSPSTAATTSRPVDLGASFIHGIVGNPLIDLAKEVPLAIARPNEASTRYLLDRSGGKSLDRDLAQRIDFFSHATTFQRLQRAAQHGHRTPLPQESIWSGLVDAKSYPDVWKGIDDAEKDCILSVASLWSGWTGARLSDVSLRWWGFEQEFPGEDVVVQPGYSHLVEWSADKIRQAGGRIVTQRRVEAVELLSDDRVRVTATDVSTASQPTVEYEATHVITALPLGVMQRTPPRFDPPLPPRRTEALQRLGMGLLNKIVLSYDRAWWLNADDGEADAWLFLLPSDFGSHDAATTHRTARQQAAMPSDEDEARTLIESGGMAVMDYSAVNGHPVLVAYAGPPVAQALEMVPPQWTVSTLHSRLVQSLVPSHRRAGADGIPAAPTSSTVTQWGRDEYSRGSYSFLRRASSPSDGEEEEGEGKGEGSSPLDMLECGKPLWQGRLGFCGEHTEPNCYASVHGALMEGERESKRIVNLLRLEEASINDAPGT